MRRLSLCRRKVTEPAVEPREAVLLPRRRIAVAAGKRKPAEAVAGADLLEHARHACRFDVVVELVVLQRLVVAQTLLPRADDARKTLRVGPVDVDLERFQAF